MVYAAPGTIFLTNTCRKQVVIGFQQWRHLNDKTGVCQALALIKRNAFRI